MYLTKFPLLIAVFTCVVSWAEPPSLTEFEQEIMDIVQKTRSHVVSIRALGSDKNASKHSGVFLDDLGHIVTVGGNLDKADSIYVRAEGEKEIEAKLVGLDRKTNLAIIKIDKTGVTPLKKGDSSKLRVGAFLISIGNPYGLSKSASLGIVSGIDRSVKIDGNLLTGLIQTTATINPGDAGGLVVDSRGRFVGIICSTLAKAKSSQTPQGINFVLPSNTIYWVKSQIVQNGEVPRGWMGVQVQDRKDSDAGVRITKIIKNSPADKSGLKTGDCLMYVNGNRIKNSHSLLHHISHTVQGQWIKFQLGVEKKSKKIVEVCLDKFK